MKRYFNRKTWVMMDQLVFSGTSFLTTILVARGAGIDTFGTYAALMLYLLLVLGIVNSLVMGPLQVLLAGTENKKAYIKNGFKIQVVCTGIIVLATALILQGSNPVLQLLRPYSISLLFLTGGFLLQDFFRRLFLLQDQPEKAFVIDLVSGGSQVVLLLLFSLQGNLPLGIICWVMGGTYLPAILIAVKSIHWHTSVPMPAGRVIRMHWQQGRWLLASALLQWWTGNFVVAAAGMLLGMPALAALRLAQTLFGVLNAMFQVFENYVTPLAATKLLQSPATLKTFLQEMLRKGLLLFLPVVLVVLLFPARIFTWSGGSAYTGYAYALQGMALLYCIIFINYPVRIAIRVMLLNRAFFIAYLGSGIFTLLTARLLVQQWELYGVILSLLLNQLLMMAYWQWMLYRKNFMLWK